MSAVPQLGLLFRSSAGGSLGRAATLDSCGVGRGRSWRRLGGRWSCSSRSCRLWRVGGRSRLLPRLRRRHGTSAALALDDGSLGTHGVSNGGTHCASGYGLIARVGTLLRCIDRRGLSRPNGCSSVALLRVQLVCCTSLLCCTLLAMAPECGWALFLLRYHCCGVTRHTQA